MWYRLEQMSTGLQRAINNMDSQQWIVVSALAVTVGVFCLRGYGSRTNY